MNVLPTTPIHEVVALQPDVHAPENPGDGNVLRIAADRWLIVGCAPAGLMAGPGFATTDVTGKWRELRLTGPAAKRLLSNCVDVDALLAQRVCARTALFDCPAVLRKTTDGYTIWIERSYLHAFTTAAEQASAL